MGATPEQPVEITIMRALLTQALESLTQEFDEGVDKELSAIVLDNKSADDLIDYLRGHPGYWPHLVEAWSRTTNRLSADLTTKLAAERIAKHQGAERRLRAITATLRDLQLSDVLPDVFVEEMEFIRASHEAMGRENLVTALRLQCDAIEAHWQRAPNFKHLGQRKHDF